MAIIITYDIPSKHQEFKEKMFELGYRESVPGDTCEIIYFPNTTLYHANKTAKEAVENAYNICSKLKVELTRCASTQWQYWYALCGEDFK